MHSNFGSWLAEGGGGGGGAGAVAGHSFTWGCNTKRHRG